MFQAGLELSERGTNQPVPEVVQVDMVELINENFLEVVGNHLVIEYFNQQNKLNQSFGISGFSGTFKVIEEIPNSLLEHHPLVVYWLQVPYRGFHNIGTKISLIKLFI